MYDLTEKNIVQVWRKESPTLLIVFSGIFPIAGASPLDFLKETRFATSNLIYLQDFYRSGYKKGLSENISSLEQLITWLKQKVAEHPIEEVVLVGASSGSIPALICAQELDAKRAWAFGPRPPVDNLFKPMSCNESPIEGRHQLRVFLCEKFAALMNRPARDWFALRDVDWALVDKQVTQLSSRNAPSSVDKEQRDYKIFHITSNKVDTAVTKRLADCPGVSCYDVELPEEKSGRWIKKSGWDHSVIQVMRKGKGLAHYMYIDELESTI